MNTVNNDYGFLRKQRVLTPLHNIIYDYWRLRYERRLLETVYEEGRTPSVAVMK